MWLIFANDVWAKVMSHLQSKELRTGVRFPHSAGHGWWTPTTGADLSLSLLCVSRVLFHSIPSSNSDTEMQWPEVFSVSPWDCRCMVHYSLSIDNQCTVLCWTWSFHFFHSKASSLLCQHVSPRTYLHLPGSIRDSNLASHALLELDFLRKLSFRAPGQHVIAGGWLLAGAHSE